MQHVRILIILLVPNAVSTIWHMEALSAEVSEASVALGELGYAIDPEGNLKRKKGKHIVYGRFGEIQPVFFEHNNWFAKETQEYPTVRTVGEFDGSNSLIIQFKLSLLNQVSLDTMGFRIRGDGGVSCCKTTNSSLWVGSPEKTPAITGATVQFDCDAFFPVFGETIQVWKPVPEFRSVELNPVERKATYVIRSYTPHDSERFGTNLSSVSIRHNFGVDSVRGFQTTLKPGRINYDRLKQSLENMETTPCDELPKYEMTDQAIDAASKLWKHVWNENQPLTPAERDLRERAAIAIVALGALRELGDEKSHDIANGTLAGILQQGYALAEARLNSGPLCVMEPCKIWHEFEKIIGINRSAVLYMHVADAALKGRGSLNSRIQLMDAMYDFGVPSGTIAKYVLAISPRDRFQKTIERSRTFYTCDESHHNACVAQFDKVRPEHTTALVAVETLIRLDKCDLVPEVNMDAWFSACIADASPHEQKLNLTLISCQRTGREELLRRLNHADKSLIAQIKATLSAQCEATKRTRRFDYMPEARCDEILMLLNEQE